jgi:hypothetical protein
MLWEILPEFLRFWRGIRSESILLPRVIYYLLTFTASPFAVVSLLRRSPAGRARIVPLAIWLGLSALGGGLFIILVVLIPLRTK